jgi:hypothetical protein
MYINSNTYRQAISPNLSVFIENIPFLSTGFHKTSTRKYVFSSNDLPGKSDTNETHEVMTFPLICSISIDTKLTVPARRPIKPVYVKKFLELIDEVAHEKD